MCPEPPTRQPGSALRFAALIFALCVFAYVAFFSLDQWLRTRRGPWAVTFTRVEDGSAALAIDAPRLGIGNLRIVFKGEPFTNASVTVRFDRPQLPVPFGSVVFSDLTYLPGTVTLHAFGHEVELLPRTLIVNRKELGWPQGLVLQLGPEDKPAALPAPTRPKRR